MGWHQPDLGVGCKLQICLNHLQHVGALFIQKGGEGFAGDWTYHVQKTVGDTGEGFETGLHWMLEALDKKGLKWLAECVAGAIWNRQELIVTDKMTCFPCSHRNCMKLTNGHIWASIYIVHAYPYPAHWQQASVKPSSRWLNVGESPAIFQ